jgi:hypothetical protein
MHTGAWYLRNSRNADIFCQARLYFWTTSVDLVPKAFLMGNWFTHTVIRPVSQPLHFGAFKLPSLPNCRPFRSCACLLHLSIRITTAAAFPSLSYSYPIPGGWFLPQNVYSPTMVILLSVLQLLLWGFIWTPDPKLTHWCSAHHPLAAHFHWQLSCGNHSIRRNMVCHLPRMMRHLTTAQCLLSTQHFHWHWYRLCFQVAFDRCISCIFRALTPWSLMVPLSFCMTAYAPPLMAHPLQTFSNTTLVSNFMTMIIPTFDPSCHLSSRCALGWLISWDTDFPSMIIGLHLTLEFQLCHQRGFSTTF